MLFLKSTVSFSSNILSNISVKLFWIWASDKNIFLFLALAAFFSKEQKGLCIFWWRGLWGTFLENYFEFRPVVQEMSLNDFLFLGLVAILFSRAKPIVHTHQETALAFIPDVLSFVNLIFQNSLTFPWNFCRASKKSLTLNFFSPDLFPDHGHPVDGPKIIQAKYSYKTTYMGLDIRKPVFGVPEQHSHQPACESVQTDQSLCFSLIGKYHI